MIPVADKTMQAGLARENGIFKRPIADEKRVRERKNAWEGGAETEKTAFLRNASAA